MIKSKDELKKAVAEYLSIPSDRLDYVPLDINNSMSSKIEDGFDGSIFCLKDGKTNIDYIAKLKSDSFIVNVGRIMNYFDDRKFDGEYKKGYGVFYTRNCYCREKYIFERLAEPLKRNIPKYYGSVEKDKECVHIMERLDIRRTEISLEPVTEFLAKLHAYYFNDEESAKRLNANFPLLSDYELSVGLTHMLLDNITVLYPEFPKEILMDLHKFTDRARENYYKMISLPRTLCHGDFCVKNLTFLPDGVCVYDWELATYNNPEFDLVSFLVHYPYIIDGNMVEEFLNGYRRRIGEISAINFSDEEIKANMAFNVLLYMDTRFHAMMNICKRVDMPYMPVSISNWIFLYRYFNGFH